MDLDLIKAHKNVDKLMPYLHLPIQSGSDNILKKMNRKYTANEYLKIVKKLGFKFKNPELIYIALTHKSRLSSGENNQRLEFLGDSILSAVITEYLYEKFIDDNEGRLTSMRASLVNEDSLFNLAKIIDLNEFVLMSDEELSREGNLRKAALADTYLSLIHIRRCRRRG